MTEELLPGMKSTLENSIIEHIESYTVEYVAAIDKDGEVFLYDIYLHKKWLGSRRLLKYARNEALCQIRKKL